MTTAELYERELIVPTGGLNADLLPQLPSATGVHF